ncbi:MAG: hypothetical protein NVS1B14_05740 [Vulcanimicrobiaceae bacterium]
MTKAWKTFSWVAAFAGFALLTEGVILVGRDVPPAPGAQPVVLGPGGVTAHRMSTKSWTLAYDHAQTSPDGSVAQIDGIHDGVLFRAGKPFIRISARHVSVNTLSDDFTASGNVHVEQLKASMTRSFDTQLIVWTNATKTLTISHPSTIKTGGSSMTVDKVIINLKTGTVHLGNVGGSLTI